MMSSFEEFQILIKRAKDFLVEAEEAIQNNRFDLSSFFAEQAVQLYLKAVLLKIVGDYPKTHYIRVLLSRLSQVLPDDKRILLEDFMKRNRAKISELEDTYITARYIPKIFGKDDAIDLVNLAKELINLVSKLCEIENE